MAKALEEYRVRVARPVAKCLGHEPASTSFICIENGVRYEFHDGIVVRVSDACKEIADMTNNPPLVQPSLIDRFPDIFIPLKPKKGKVNGS